MEKICSKCNTLKNNFFKDKSHPDGYRSECSDCGKAKKRQIYLRDKQKIKIQNKKSRDKNPLNKERAILRSELWRKNNKEKFNSTRRKRDEFRRNNDPQYKLKYNLRHRLKAAIKQNIKMGSAVKDLGCSISEFKLYIESQFLPGMNWNNYGQWHIDHVIPISKFDLTNETELQEACNYLNLQPMWALDNIKKGNKL